MFRKHILYNQLSTRPRRTNVFK